MPKIIFFSRSVSITGGKERVLINLANYLAENGFLIEIVTYDGSTKSSFQINGLIKTSTKSLSFLNYTEKNNLAKLWHFWGDIRAYKKFKPDIQPSDQIVATDQIIATVVHYAFSKKTRNFIVWEHLSYINYQGTIWDFFVKRIYPRAKLVVALSKEEESYYKSIACETVCIPNAILPGKQSSPKQGNPFVWVGSLTKEKGVDDVIKIGKLLLQNSLNIQIQVFGAGPCEDYLKHTINADGLENFIILKGVEKDINTIYGNAYALIVTSKHECFPTVILEAFSYGIPVIAYDCPTGPRNIITQNKTGFLVKQGNVGQLYQHITNLAASPGSAVKMGSNAFAASNNYSPGIIYPQWDKMLNS